MVSVKSFMTSEPVTAKALGTLMTQATGTGIEPHLVCAFYGCEHDDAAIHSAITSAYPGAALIGGTSCSGLMTQYGVGSPDAIGLLLVEDPDGSYGSASASLGPDPAATAEATLRAALAAADCPGELPELIWIYQAPGSEELVIEGLRRVVSDLCPIIGGSSADNTVEGRWRQLGPDGPMSDGLIVGVMFSSGGIGFAFQGGYEPTGPSGIVTRVAFDTAGESGIVTKSRGRHILSIDGEPASAVYNRWIGGGLSSRLEAGGDILVDTTMTPLGVHAGQVGDVSHYLLIHPAAISPDGGLTTFATVEEGTRIHSMRGDKDRLIERAGRVASSAISMVGGKDELAGGLLVYCAGCMLAVGDQMPRVATAVSASFSEAPFLGCFTFGEQGFVTGSNVHGNLMISAIVFGR